MSININTVLNNIAKNYNPSTVQKKQNTTVDENIFAQASALVAEFKNKQANSKEDNTNSSTTIGGLSFTKIANMSTSDFLKYAYENKAESGFNENQGDSSGIKLPMLVRYKGQVICTAGKTFMAVVAKFHAKYPHRSEEEIAAELLAKYGDNNSASGNSSTKSSAGNALNLSA